MKVFCALVCAFLFAGSSATTVNQNNDDLSSELKGTKENVKWLNPIKHLAKANLLIDISLPRIDNEEVCSILTPDNQFIDVSNTNIEGIRIQGSSYFVSCRFTIGPMVEDLIGDWTVCGSYKENDEEHKRCQTVNIFWSPQPDWHIHIHTLYNYSVHFGSTMTPTVMGIGDIVSCHLHTPTGENLVIDQDSDYPSIKASPNQSTCSFEIGPIHQELLGDWTIVGIFANSVQGLYEEIYPFHMFLYDKENPDNQAYNVTILPDLKRAVSLGTTLDVEVSVNAGQVDSCYIEMPSGRVYKKGEENVFEGATFYEANDGSVSCRVTIGPITKELLGDWKVIGKFSNNGIFTERQQPIYLIREETVEALQDVVTLTEGDDIYIFNVEDTTALTPTSTSLTLLRDRPFDQVVGPENAVYCRLEDPQGFAVFDNFGRCRLSLDKVGLEHDGTWKMIIAAPGNILTEEHQLFVTVKESAGKPVVTTKVEQEESSVIILCSIQTNDTVTGCMFRKPQGKILIASNGLVENRYKFYGKGASYESGVRSHECGILITNPINEDLGLWRCALDTVNETYYGHILVLSNLTNAVSVQQEPILKATRPVVSVVEGERTTMSCAVESVIRYCYFRASNGTIFTVTPGMSSSSIEYVGAGFAAGECGIRFDGLDVAASGRWSCSVGLQGVAGEQRDQFQVTVHESMHVRHFIGEGNFMTVEGIVYEGRALEYCRFIRVDGFGFTSDSLPPEYIIPGNLSNGECRFRIWEPTMLERHPWTIAARIRGQDVEIVRNTMESVIIAPPTTEGPGTDTPPTVVNVNNNGFIIFTYMFLSLLLVFLILGACLGPRKHRQWTAQRVTAFRTSFRKPQQQNPPTTTPPYRA